MERFQSSILFEHLGSALRTGDIQESDQRFHPRRTGSPGEKPCPCVLLSTFPRGYRAKEEGPEGIELIKGGFLEEVAFELDLMADCELEVKM